MQVLKKEVEWKTSRKSGIMTALAYGSIAYLIYSTNLEVVKVHQSPEHDSSGHWKGLVCITNCRSKQRQILLWVTMTTESHVCV